jgi:hypothetical protein
MGNLMRTLSTGLAPRQSEHALFFISMVRSQPPGALDWFDLLDAFRFA